MSTATLDELVKAGRWWRSQRSPEEVVQQTTHATPTGLYVIKQSVADGTPSRIGDFVRTLDHIDYDEGKIYFSDVTGTQWSQDLTSLFFERFYVFNIRESEIPNGAKKFSEVKVRPREIQHRHNRLWRVAFNRIMQSRGEGSLSGIQTYLRPVTSTVLAAVLAATIAVSGAVLHKMESNPIQHEQEELHPITHDEYREHIKDKLASFRGDIQAAEKEVSAAQDRADIAEREYDNSYHKMKITEPYYTRRRGYGGYSYNPPDPEQIWPGDGKRYAKKSTGEFIDYLIHHVRHHKVVLRPQRGSKGHDGYTFELDEHVVNRTTRSPYSEPEMYEFWICKDLIKDHDNVHAKMGEVPKYKAVLADLHKQVEIINRFAFDFGVEPITINPIQK